MLAKSIMRLCWLILLLLQYHLLLLLYWGVLYSWRLKLILNMGRKLVQVNCVQHSKLDLWFKYPNVIYYLMKPENNMNARKTEDTIYLLLLTIYPAPGWSCELSVQKHFHMLKSPVSIYIYSKILPVTGLLGLLHLAFPSGHQSEYWPDSMRLKFGCILRFKFHLIKVRSCTVVGNSAIQVLHIKNPNIQTIMK